VKDNECEYRKYRESAGLLKMRRDGSGKMDSKQERSPRRRMEERRRQSVVDWEGSRSRWSEVECPEFLDGLPAGTQQVTGNGGWGYF